MIGPSISALVTSGIVIVRPTAPIAADAMTDSANDVRAQVAAQPPQRVHPGRRLIPLLGRLLRGR